MRSITRVAMAVSVAALLAACGGDGDSNNDGADNGGNTGGDTGVVDTGGGDTGGGDTGGGDTGATATLQDGFGADFAAAFGDGANVAGDPEPVEDGDIIAVSLTADPEDIPNP